MLKMKKVTAFSQSQKRKQRFFNTKKAATTVPMAIGVLVVAILIIILGFFILKTAISNRVSEENICPEITLLLESAYASPGEFNNTYHLPVSAIPKNCFDECLAFDKCTVDPYIYEALSSSIDINIYFSRSNGAHLYLRRVL